MLGNDAVLRIEPSGLRKEGLCSPALSQEPGLAGLVDEFSDAVFASERDGQGILAAGWIEPLSFGKLSLCTC
jgi:hypothetical protein